VILTDHDLLLLGESETAMDEDEARALAQRIQQHPRFFRIVEFVPDPHGGYWIAVEFTDGDVQMITSEQDWEMKLRAAEMLREFNEEDEPKTP
jgi:hypothetical protein